MHARVQGAEGGPIDCIDELLRWVEHDCIHCSGPVLERPHFLNEEIEELSGVSRARPSVVRLST